MNRREAILSTIASATLVACGKTKIIDSKPIATNSQELFAHKLTFNNKRFTIVQLTDLHINMQKNNFKVVEPLIREVIATQQPDLVAITGDVVVTGSPKSGYEALDQVFKELKTNYAIVLGNHDAEKNTSRKAVEEIIESMSSFCLNKATNQFEGSNFTIALQSAEKKKTEAVLYFLDSNSYSTLKPKVDGYGWFLDEQVDWYKRQSKQYTVQNNGKPIPALAFFHIPLPEYNQVWDNQNNVIGVKKEEVCCPKLNTGMFAEMVFQGDVMGTFVGHDHVNDYIGTLNDIALVYGRGGGSTNTYGDQVQGARIIKLTEGKREFDTYIYEIGGKTVNHCSYPTSFPKPQKK